jgi:hypothetical protein
MTALKQIQAAKSREKMEFLDNIFFATPFFDSHQDKKKTVSFS